MVAGIFWSRVGNIKACIDKGLTRKQIDFKIVHYFKKTNGDADDVDDARMISRSRS